MGAGGAGVWLYPVSWRLISRPTSPTAAYTLVPKPGKSGAWKAWNLFLRLITDLKCLTPGPHSLHFWHLMPLGRAGINVSQLLITHYVHEFLSSEEGGWWICSNFGQGCREDTICHFLLFLFFSFFLYVINQFTNWEAVSLQSSLPITPAERRLRTREGGCKD